MAKLRIAIVGCNNMGRKHLTLLREYFADEVEIAGILNSTAESSARKAAELDVPYFSSLDEIILQYVDAAIISTPGITHAEIGEKLLSRGIPCLMEKPLAHTLDGCEKMIAAAKAGGVDIIAGHTENYNPAFIRLKQELKAPVKRISGIRTSANSGNSTGITAVQELMIHDLAIIHSLLGDKVKTAAIHKNPKYSWENHAVAEMTYDNGAEVRIEALREFEHPIERQMEIEDVDGNLFNIGFRERRVSKNGTVLTDNDGNSLVNELRNFINTVKGMEKPLVNAYEATDILKLCLHLEKEIGNQEQRACWVKKQQQILR